MRSLLFFTLQPHRPKTRHQKWPSEIENRNDAPVARSGTRRLSLIRRMGPICADFGGPPANTGEDRTGWILASFRAYGGYFPAPHTPSGTLEQPMP